MSNLLRSKGLLSLVLVLSFWNPALMYAADPASPATPDGASAAAPDPAPNGVNLSSPNAVLLNLLVSKGILTTGEAASLSSATGQAGTQQLLLILKQKGVITDSDVSAMQSSLATSERTHHGRYPSGRRLDRTVDPGQPNRSREAKGSFSGSDGDSGDRALARAAN